MRNAELFVGKGSAYIKHFRYTSIAQPAVRSRPDPTKISIKNNIQIRSGIKCIQQSKLSARPKFRIPHSEFRIHLLRRPLPREGNSRIKHMQLTNLPFPRDIKRRCRSVSVIPSSPKARFLPRGGNVTLPRGGRLTRVLGIC